MKTDNTPVEGHPEEKHPTGSDWEEEFDKTSYLTGYTDGKGDREKDIQELEKMKKSVKELFPDVKAEPTAEFAQFVMMKDQYNRGLNTAIDYLKGKN